jgi:signal peptide peptidase SppA
MMNNMLMVAKDSLADFCKLHQTMQAGASMLPANYAGRADMLTTRRQKLAIIPITGMIGKESFMEYYGGTSLDLLTSRLVTAANDGEVSHILMPVHSPGGYTTAVEQTASLIRDITATKPVIALVQGNCCSAAYWLASAASAIYTDGQSARVGSIGVYASFFDLSKYLAENGITAHEFTTGKYKALGSPYHAPSEDEKTKIQEGVDTLFTFFVNSVSKYRNISKDTVLKSADGQVFFAKDAAERKLTDGQLTLNEVIAMTEAENKVVAQAAQLEALTKSNEEMKARLEKTEAVLTAKAKAEEEAATKQFAIKAETLYQTHMGRAPTDAEKAAYVASSPEIRTSLEGALEAITKARDEQASSLGLDQDVASTGTNPSASISESGLLLQALARVQGR